MDTPFAALHLAEVDSTQLEARSRFAGEPLLVTADRQTRGRGRLGREWVQATRAVSASLAFRPGWPSNDWPRLTLVAGLAACRVLRGEVRLKWPNDLVVGELKIGGLLAEAEPGLVVIGLGVNLFWPRPLDGAAGLLTADPGPTRATELSLAWVAELLSRAGRDSDDWGRQEYLSLCSTLGREVSWEPAGRGVAVGITVDGSLEVEGPAGIVVLRSGEVGTLRAI